MKARLFLSPLHEPLSTKDIVEETRLTDLIDLEVHEYLSDGGVIRLNSELIPPDKWNAVVVKPHAGSTLDFIYVPKGKKAFALLATIATVALVAAVTAFGLPFIGVAAGSLLASLIAGGIGIAGSLLVTALTAPPKAGNNEARPQNVEGGVGGNALTLLDHLPVVFGKMGLSPPLLAPPYSTMDGDDTYWHFAVGVEGRCLIENVKVNGIPIADFADSTYETREGYAGDADRTIYTKTVIEERDGVQLTNMKTALADNYSDDIADQDDPDSCLPQWHMFETAGTWDEIVLRFNFPAGIVRVDNGLDAFVPIRIQIRKKGDSTWRAMPVVHIADYKAGAGPVKTEVRLMRQLPEAGRHFSCMSDEAPIFEVISYTSAGESFFYEADSYFATTDYPVPGPQSAAMTSNSSAGQTVSSSSDLGSGTTAYKAFDYSNVTYWAAAANSLPAWLKIQYPSAKTIKSIEITTEYTDFNVANLGTSPVDFIIEGSNDDSAWTDLCGGMIDCSDDPTQVFILNISSPGSYLYYRVTFTNNNGAASEALRILSMELYTEYSFGSKLGISGTLRGSTAIHTDDVKSGLPRTRYVSLSKDGAKIFLDPASWDSGAYEVRVMRGMAAQENQFTEETYSWDGSDAKANFFDYYTSGSSYLVRIGQKNYKSDCFIECFQTVVNSAPFDPTGIALIAATVKNVSVNSIYAEFTRYAPNYGGSVWETELETTQNPASLYRHLLLGASNAKPVPGDSIDEDALAEWFNECVTNSYQANAVLQGVTVGEAKQMLATCGYAFVQEADMYRTISDNDTTALPIRYLITPMNSKDEGNVSEVRDLPDAIRAEFNDEDLSYAINHTVVYRDGVSSANAKLFDTVRYTGFTDLTKVAARAAFDLKQLTARSARYSREVGLGALGLERGDVVGLSDDTLDGDMYAGWIKSVEVSGGNVISITLDNIVPWSVSTDFEQVEDLSSISDVLNPTQNMGVAIRIGGSDVLTKQISTVSDSNVCTFTTPFTDDGSIVPNLLVVAGKLTKLYRRCKVLQILPRGFENRLLILTDEAPELY